MDGAFRVWGVLIRELFGHHVLFFLAGLNLTKILQFTLKGSTEYFDGFKSDALWLFLQIIAEVLNGNDGAGFLDNLFL